MIDEIGAAAPVLMTTDKLVKTYIKIRDKRDELSAAFKEKEAELKALLEALEGELLEICKTQGADSIRTEYGTATRKVSKRFWTADWSSFHAFVMENNAPDLMERRVAQGNMQQFLEEHPDKLPPGLNIDSRFAITVRRSK
jgi:hypothetical protein